MSVRVPLAAALSAAVLLAGCGGGPQAGGATTAPRTSTPATTSTVPSPTPTEFVGGVLARCFIPKSAATVRPVKLRGPGLRLPGIVFEPAGGGDGTVLVLLHQTDGYASCGWDGFGRAAAAAGMSALAYDQCTYGGARCTVGDPNDPVPQVRLALAYARKHLGARRIVLVGASMGGSRVVRAVAGGAEVDGWADVSGPASWDGAELASLAPRIHVPGLVSTAADTDGEAAAASAEALARSTGATWVPGEHGHGYELLTDTDGRLLPVGERVLAFARG